MRSARCSEGGVAWASVREVYNIFQAEEGPGANREVPHDIPAQALSMAGRDLERCVAWHGLQLFDRTGSEGGGSRWLPGRPGAAEAGGTAAMKVAA